MKHTKRIVAALAAVTAAVPFAACGNSSDVLTENSPAGETAAPAVSDALTDAADAATETAVSQTESVTEQTKTEAVTEQTKTEAVTKQAETASDNNSRQTTAQPHQTQDTSGRGADSNGLLQYQAGYYYASRTNHFPEFVDIEEEDGDSVTLHLYDLIDNHTSTCDWYYIDRNTMKGTNFLGDAIDLKNDQAKLWTPGDAAYSLVPNDAYAAVLYLGTLDRSTLSADILTEMKFCVDSSEYAKQYPFLKDIPADRNYFATELGTEIWMILPKDDSGWITLNAMEPDTVKYRITQTGNSAPVIVCCNFSDIYSDINVQITYPDRSRAGFSPYISLKDGNPVTTDEANILVLN